MSTKEALLQEIERVPDPLLDEVLAFVRFLTSRIPTPRHEAARTGESTLGKAVGLLRTGQPAPADEQVREWLAEERLRRYG